MQWEMLRKKQAKQTPHAALMMIFNTNFNKNYFRRIMMVNVTCPKPFQENLLIMYGGYIICNGNFTWSYYIISNFLLEHGITYKVIWRH